MKASQRRLVTASVAILIVIISGLVIRNCGLIKQEEIKIISGQTKSMGSISWSVVSVMKLKTIEPNGANITAKGWFLVVDFYLKNEGKEKIQLSPDSLVLFDSSGETYSPNKKATDGQIKALINTKVDSVFNTTLVPNKQQRLVGVYEVPETATKLQMRILGRDFGSKKDLIIALGF